MAILAKPGTWAISRIVIESDGGFNTAAAVQGLAPQVENYYPPMTADYSGYVLPVALVRLVGAVGTPDASTWLLPPLTTTLRQLSGAQRSAARSLLDGRLTGYSFRDWDGATVVKAAWRSADLSLDSPFADVVSFIFEHLAHSTARNRPATPESHNTEYLDDFSTDPASRWTSRATAYTWDSGNSEIDLNHAGAAVLEEYTANTPGSIEHESQVTAVVGVSEERCQGPGIRVDGGVANDFYALQLNRSTALAQIVMRQGGSMSVLATNAITIAGNDFFTMRLAASGTAGSNVALAAWHTNHGSSKPSDPGWYGTDGSPTFSYTDSGATRLDDSTHDACGIAGYSAISADYDTRHCFWKSRAISDRGGAAATPHHVFGKMLVGPFGGPI